MTASWQFPWDTPPAPVATPADPDPTEASRKPRGRRPAAVTRVAALARRTAPDWRYHHLTISGPAALVAAFAVAARGSGITPWQLDYARIEEDIFLRAVSQPASRRNLTVEGCRILARQFRDKVEARQARAAALVGQSQACPFDLHVLLAVPDAVLQLGPTDPAALSWLRTHWGVTDRLRQVVERETATTGRRLPKSHGVLGYGFFTAGETPNPAITQIATRWPGLRFVLQPRPAD
ncbi:MAG: hypothetical protein QOD93_2392 [Acetobacteraceae bacterium]|nr:hypothetical protein [Acetobacteraceae bacterium]